MFRLAVTEMELGLAAQRDARPELAFEEEPAPRRLAPYAAAIAASVLEGDTEIGWGKFVLLYDPAGHARLGRAVPDHRLRPRRAGS